LRFHLLSLQAPLLALMTALGAVPAHAAASAAEICAEGTGIPREDVLVCTRALILSTLSPVSVATLHNARGRALRLIGEPDKSLAAHNAALTANPLSAEAHLGRAETRMVLGNADAAMADARAALDLNPQLAAAWRLQGRIHFLTGDDANAEATLTRALKLNASDGEAHAFRGLNHYRHARYGEALTAFRKARASYLDYQYLPLWEWLAARAAAVETKDSLEIALDELRPGQWPTPLLEAYLERRDPQSIKIDPDTTGSAAEVAFYLGERDRLLGNESRAHQRLQQAASALTPLSVERAMLAR
jgi:tetratricopeptide (TPR) repeat protein